MLLCMQVAQSFGFQNYKLKLHLAQQRRIHSLESGDERSYPIIRYVGGIDQCATVKHRSTMSLLESLWISSRFKKTFCRSL
jgi:hypothetical protein